MAFKMTGKSPLMKKLIGGQHNLPGHLQKAIVNSPAKQTGIDDGNSPMKMYGKKSPAKMDLTKKKGLGPRAAKGSDDQSKQLARSRYEMGMYKNDPTKASSQDDKVLDKAQDAAGVGKGSNRKVMKDGAVNKTQAAKMAKRKADFAKKTPAEKKAMQAAANKKRKDFEATPAYKKRKKAADAKTKAANQGNFKPAYEGADYSKEDISKMTPKQKKNLE